MATRRCPCGHLGSGIKTCRCTPDQVARYQGKLSGPLLDRIDQHVALDNEALKFLNVAATRLGWSARSTHRALKVARTIADLAGAKDTQTRHVAEAMQYRRALMALT